MICPNCGYGDANADPIGGRCPNCGTPYAASDTASTQAAFVAPLSSPSSPYTQPYTIPAPPLEVGGPTPPTAIPTYPPPPANRRRPVSRVVLISVGVVVAMALLGGIAYAITLHGSATAATNSTTSSSSTAPASPTKVPGVTLAHYSDPNHQFTIKYPSTWSPTSASTTANGKSINLTTFTAPNEHTAYLVAISSAALAFTDVSTLLGSTVTGYMPGAPTMETLKGIVWQYEMGPAQVHGKNGGAYALLSQQGSMSYLLLAYGEGAKFGTNGGKAFLKIARTFTPQN